MSIDLEAYAVAACAANILLTTGGAIGDADAIDRLADDMTQITSPSPLHPLVMGELRVRAEHIRELALEGARRRGWA